MDTHVVFSIHTCSSGKEWQLIDVAYVRIWFGFVVDLEHVWKTFRRTTFLVGLGVVGGRGNSCVGGREEADMGWWDGRGRGEVGGRPPQSPGARHQGRVSEQNVQEMKDQRKTIFKTNRKVVRNIVEPKHIRQKTGNLQDQSKFDHIVKDQRLLNIDSEKTVTIYQAPSTTLQNSCEPPIICRKYISTLWN